MRVRHQSLKSMVINTHFGEVELDQNGLVTNLGKLKIRGEDFLKDYGHDFLNAEIFPPEGVDLGPEPPELVEAKVEESEVDQEEVEKRAPTDEEYWGIIEGLLNDEKPAPKNNSGYIDMKHLNDYLTLQNLPTITGTKRKDITNKFSPDHQGLEQTESAV